jgi:hypothetical protein
MLASWAATAEKAGELPAHAWLLLRKRVRSSYIRVPFAAPQMERRWRAAGG